MKGLRVGKFEVRHHRRGPLPAEDVFVLVPGRDPAAVAAIRAYAEHTGDSELAAALIGWADAIDGAPARERIMAVDRVAGWTATLATEVHGGRMDVETALQRIAGHAIDAGRREVGGAGLTPRRARES